MARPTLRAGDFWGALASMLVALPSAIAFGVVVFTAIGPEHAAAGALAGAVGAATLGLVAPLVGGNGGFITAPCAPAAAVMSGLAAVLTVEHGLPAGEVASLLVVAALLSAALQIAYGLLRLGRLIKFIPYQVVSGYLSGVALIIALGQLPKMLGLPPGGSLLDDLSDPTRWQGPAIAVGAATIAITATGRRITRRVPAPVLGLVGGTLTYFLIASLGRPDLFDSSNPLVIGPIGLSSDVLSVVVERGRGLVDVEVGDLTLVLSTAATLSVLLSIDTLKTGVVLDALTRRRSRSNRELVAQGVANVASALTGGMPGAGTMGPTLVNVTSGGRSPLSGFLEGVLSIVALVALGRFMAWVPLAALAGILLVVAFRMFEWRAFRLLRHGETRLDFFVIMSVVVVAETLGLIEASIVGIALAILLFIRDQIRGSVIRARHDLTRIRSATSRLGEARQLLDEHGEQGLLVQLEGNLFFGTTDQLLSDLAEDVSRRRYILLDLRLVRSIDYTAAHLLEVLQEQLEEREGTLLLAGLPSHSPTRQDIEDYLARLGLVRGLGGIPIHETRDEALEWMEDRILEAAGWTEPVQIHVLEIGEIELFREFRPAVLERLESIASEVHLEADETLFEQGAAGDELYLVRRGAIVIDLPLPGGLRHHLSTISRGDYFGEVAFLDRGLRSAAARAKTATDLYAISRKRFDAIAHAEPVVATMLFARLALVVSQRLRRTTAALRALEER